jgi:carbamoyltransferase
MKKILGISAFYHDSAAAIIVDGEIIAAAQEERFNRIKNTSLFPSNAIKYCLKEANINLDQLDAVVFYDKPNLKFERLIKTHLYFAPKGLKQFLIASNDWVRNKINFKSKLVTLLLDIQHFDKNKIELIFSEHHLSHSASSFFTSNFKESAILTIDGVGEWATASISIGTNNDITLLKEMRFPNSIGLLYSCFTYFLGFKVNSGEYKLMGLAPYGNFESDECKLFIRTIKENLVSINADGSIILNLDYFNYHIGLSMIHVDKWETIFGISKLNEGDNIKQCHCNLALAIQHVTEEIVIKMAIETRKITNCDYLCLAGGVALNCVANGKLLDSNIFKDIYIQPASGDAGGAIGAALAAYYIYFGKERIIVDAISQKNTDLMKGSYLGPSYNEIEIMETLDKLGANYTKYDDFQEIVNKISDEINSGKVIGWFQDRMEFGPRALGNRSIIADARNCEMQKKLNLKIKYREGFRPFAPAVLEEIQSEYFDLNKVSPYMLFVAPVNDKIKKQPPSNYAEMDLWDKLYFQRSLIPAITHIDYSARIQSVRKKTNSKFHALLSRMQSKHNIGLVINTSFNVRGEPIVCSPKDAYICFMSTDMDFLVIDNFILIKEKQGDYQDKERWKKIYIND